MALDSPLEALALNYLNYGFMTANIWAWIAIVTAAVSLWRIRALSSSKLELSSTSQDTASKTANAKPPVEKATVSSSNETRTSPAPLEREGSVKVKFSLCYEKEDRGENEEFGGGEAAVMMSRELDAWRNDWEMMMVMKMADMGWYRRQYRMVLDGSVVRLWEGRWRKHAAAQAVSGGAAW